MPEILLWHWFAFVGLVAVLLALDLMVFHRHDHAPSIRESAGWTIFWFALAMAFNGFIWWWQGRQPAVEFLTGFIVELSLSIDNVFVFAVIFRYFNIPLKYQYRVLFWGILGAIVLRLLFVVLGSALIKHFEWILPLFGVFLVYTAFRLALQSEKEVHPEKNLLLRLARRFFKVSKGDHREHGHAFFVMENDIFCFTPMFLVLLVVESTDVLFAVDSVPAIFGITLNIFIIYTSNIFAILGLRAKYFLLAGMIEMFDYLHYGLSAVLGFVGLSMIGDWWFQPEGGHFIPTWVKLLIIAVILGISIVVSIIVKKPEGGQETTSQG
ncbi:MAG TPA: TerC family protein [Thermoguttaceae bacterium]